MPGRPPAKKETNCTPPFSHPRQHETGRGAGSSPRDSKRWRVRPPWHIARTWRWPCAAAMWSAESRSKSVVRPSSEGRELSAAARRPRSPDCTEPKKSTSSLGRPQLAPWPIAAGEQPGVGDQDCWGLLSCGVEQRTGNGAAQSLVTPPPACGFLWF
jgi:hypothetical protein